MSGREQNDEEHGHDDDKSRRGRERVFHDDVGFRAIALLHLDEGLFREEQPGEDGAHEGAVQQVEREADLAQPEEVAVRQREAQVGGHDHREAEEEGAHCGPGAVDEGVLAEDAVVEF